jgi:hypothetical protein
MKSSRIILFGWLLLTILGTSAENVFGCRCFPGTVDSRYANATFVAIVKVEALGKSFEPDNTPSYFVRVPQTRVSIKQVFKGDLQVGEKVIFRNTPKSMCGWSFEEEDIGNDFLIFFQGANEAGKEAAKPKLWTTSWCSGTAAIGRKAGDLSYLHDYEKVRGKTRISGMLWKEIGTVNQAIVRHGITVVGNGKEIRLVTNSEGLYEVYDLPPGKYRIVPDQLKGSEVRSSRHDKEVDLKAGGHVEANIYFSASTANLWRIKPDQTGVELLSSCPPVSLKR